MYGHKMSKGGAVPEQELADHVEGDSCRYCGGAVDADGFSLNLADMPSDGPMELGPPEELEAIEDEAAPPGFAEALSKRPQKGGAVVVKVEAAAPKEKTKASDFYAGKGK